ncbi:3-oxoadipate enol-lactonase [Orrella marina]|uniref:3-oxoadipate enol-lactonase n=1 Tax=Orrella marina TaxID=2163011 RepID=A0A2R4XFQ3_9BURK|nr:3-oxoadipate enol-lactonase [Orrella marina]AWB32533.1 3-oxoadipate enol-lactonase [Orrella marina]
MSQSQQPYLLDTRQGKFRVCDQGEPSAPVLMLSNSLGTTLEMWEPQIEAFTRHYRVIRYDTRGHGGSPVAPGPYTFDGLGEDALAILDALKIEKASFCGVSMGGHSALWMGIHAAARFEALIVCNSAARIGTTEAWKERADLVRANGKDGMQTLASTAPGRWFTKGFVERDPQAVQAMQAVIASTDPEGYASCCDALGSSDLRPHLGRITNPTLIIAGEFDPATTVADGQAMHDAIAGSELVVLPVSHISNVEAAKDYNDAVLAFLEKSRR